MPPGNFTLSEIESEDIFSDLLPFNARVDTGSYTKRFKMLLLPACLTISMQLFSYGFLKYLCY